TNGTPTAEPFVDLRGERRLLLEGTLSLNLRIRDIAHRNPAGGRTLHLTGNKAEYCVTHFRHIPQPLQMIVIVRCIETEEIGCDHGRCESGRRDLHDVGRTTIVFRKLSGIGFEQLPRGSEILGLGRDARIMGTMEGLLLEFRRAVEAHDRADYYVA